MRYEAAIGFTLKTPKGDIVVPTGSMLELSPEQAIRLGGKIRPADAPTLAPLDWRPEFKAWLTDADELRTTGVTDDLAAAIRDLTADNLRLQAKLLRRHCGRYHGQGWHATVRAWRELAASHFEQNGPDLHAANYRAASEMNLLCFAGELRLKEPPS